MNPDRPGDDPLPDPDAPQGPDAQPDPSRDARPGSDAQPEPTHGAQPGPDAQPEPAPGAKPGSDAQPEPAPGPRSGPDATEREEPDAHDEPEADATDGAEESENLLDVDAAFAEIVAGWADEAPDPLGAWPSPSRGAETSPGEGVLGRGRRRGDRPPHAGGVPSADLPPAEGMTEPLLPRGYREQSEPDPLDAEEPAYNPDDLSTLPPASWLTRLSWAGVLGGPLALLLAVLFWRDAPRLFIAGAVLAFVAGFVMLVVHLPGRRDEDDDPGAVL